MRCVHGQEGCETGFQGLRGENRDQGPLLQGKLPRPEFAQVQLPLRQPDVRQAGETYV
jgi:hypothetical protein